MQGHAICIGFAWNLHDRYLVKRAVPVLSDGWSETLGPYTCSSTFIMFESSPRLLLASVTVESMCQED